MLQEQLASMSTLQGVGKSILGCTPRLDGGRGAGASASFSPLILPLVSLSHNVISKRGHFMTCSQLCAVIKRIALS